jgi:hypothetical protein
MDSVNEVIEKCIKPFSLVVMQNSKVITFLLQIKIKNSNFLLIVILESVNS